MILVTGGAGYIGSIIVRLVLDKGQEVIVFDNLSTGHSEAIEKDAIFVKGDLGDINTLDEVFKKHKIDKVLHLAGSCLVGESILKPDEYFKNNVINGINLLNCMIKHKVMEIIFSSTGAVYGVPNEIPIKETHSTLPVNPYGESKLIFERILSWYAKAYRVKFAILRFFNVAGAYKGLGEDHFPETHLIPNILHSANRRKKAVRIFGTDYDTPDGTCIRDYIHVRDIAHAHLLAIEKISNLKSGCGETYNLGLGKGFSVKEAIATACEVTGIEIPHIEDKRRQGDPPILIAETSKVCRELGWAPEITDLKQIISDAWEWHKAHPGGYK